MIDIAVAVISGGLSLIGVIVTVVVTVRKSNSQMIAELRRRSDASDAKLDKEVALLRAEVDELMREVRQHNNFAMRMPVLESRIERVEGDVIDLRKGVHNHEGLA